MRMALPYLKLSLMCVLFAISLRAHAESWQNPEFLQQAFNEIALKNEYEPGTMRVRKWRAPVRVWIEHKVAESDKHTNLVQMHLRHLAKITGLPMSLVPNSSEANVTVVFTDQDRWRQDVVRLMGKGADRETQHAVCMASFDLNKQGEIHQAWVVIPVDQAQMHRKLVSCIVEEITQILGLPNDSEKVYPSVFNDDSPDDLLTGLDGLLLKMLYNPQVKVGMTEAQVQPVLQKLIRQWQQDGTIENAEKSIHEGELYPLLGY